MPPIYTQNRSWKNSICPNEFEYQKEHIPMEFEEAYSNFCAIRLLYRLLEDSSLSLQNSNSNNLVERARALLKNLLDVAVEDVFEIHLKIIATEAGISKASFEQEIHVAVQDLKFPMATNISQSSVKYPTCSKMTSEKDEQLQLKLLSKKELPELSTFHISDDSGIKCKSQCSVGEESSMMQQNSVKATTNLSNDNGILPNIESSHNKQQHNDVNALYGDGEHVKKSIQIFNAKDSEQNEESNVSLLNRIHEVPSNANVVGLVEYPDQKGDLSDDLVNAIRRIESRILAFQLCSSLANSDSPVVQRNDGVSGSQLSCGKSLLEGHRLMNHKTCKPSCKGENSTPANAFEKTFFAGNESLSQSQSQVANQNHCLHTSAESTKSIKQIGTQMVSRGEWLRRQNRIHNSEENIAMIHRVKSLNRLVSSDAYFGSQASECIQGLRVPLNQDDHSKKHSMLVSVRNRESLVRKNIIAWPKTNQNRKKMSSESSYAQKLAGSKSVISRRKKPASHQMEMKATLLDQRSSEIKVNSHQHRDSSVLDTRRTHKTSHLEPHKTRVLPQHHELQDSSSNSNSSRRSSQQFSANSSSDSEDYSLQDGTHPPSSGRMVDAAYKGSPEESNNSYLEKDDGSSNRFGSFKSYRHYRERNPNETVGRLRRLKNKLGLIFHHHHHHHHHHHRHDDDHGNNTHSRAGHRHTMWNPLHSVFHHKDKQWVLTEKVEKTRRGAVARALPRRNHVGQFHRLAEGFMRHIRHSKKPKPSKFDGVKLKQSRNSTYGHSHKKLPWWLIIRRRKGVKLKNKARVKVGFMSQKSLKNY